MDAINIGTKEEPDLVHVGDYVHASVNIGQFVCLRIDRIYEDRSQQPPNQTRLDVSAPFDGRQEKNRGTGNLIGRCPGGPECSHRQSSRLRD